MSTWKTVHYQVTHSTIPQSVSGMPWKWHCEQWASGGDRAACPGGILA